MQATVKSKPSAKPNADPKLAALVTLMDERRTRETKGLLERLSQGQGIDAQLREHADRRKRWEFFRRVSKWAHGVKDPELDTFAGIK